MALWRAMHVRVDPPPHVLEDEIGLRLAAPAEGWRDRGDMDPRGSRPLRVSVVARFRFAEDLVAGQAGRDVVQYASLATGSTLAMTFQPPLIAPDEIVVIDRPSEPGRGRGG